MKKIFTVLLLLTTVFVLSGCKKEDDGNIAPVITGDATLSIEVGEGAPNWLNLITVTDEEDGTIVLDATNVNLDNVDISKTGSFDVVYTVKDSGGKETTFTLTVSVSEPITPMITNPEGTYVTIGDMTITRSEIWTEMVKVYGMSMMQRYVEEILFAEFMTGISDQEILDAKEFLLFGTNDQELIVKMMEDDDFYSVALSTFEESLLFAGYNPSIAADVRDYLLLDLAKAAYTKDYLTNADDEDGFYITDSQLEQFYTESRVGTVCAVSVEFASGTEFNNVLEHFNLVDNYNYGIGEYFGVTPIAELSSDMFNDTNTTQLTDEEVFAKFILVYNYMNPFMPQIPEDVTEATYCSDYKESSEFVYDDMMEGVTSSTHPMTLYTNLMFRTLQVSEEDTTRYTYTNNNISGYHKFVFKVAQESVTDFDLLSSSEKQDLKVEFIELMTVSEVITTVTGQLIQENELEMYDPTFRMIFEFENNKESDVLNSETIVAVYDDIEITADELFEYIEVRAGVNIATTIYENKTLLNSTYFDEKFGTERNLLESDNENVLDYYTQLDEISTNFYDEAYLQYGFDPANLSYREFLFLGFGEFTEEEVILNVFILPNLQVDSAVDNLPSYVDVETHLNLLYNEYFSLSVSHVLIYLDLDNDFVPDDFQEYTEGLTPEEITELNGLKVLYENLLNERLDAEKTFKEIQTEYNGSLIGDETNPWAPLKQYGFKLKQEELTTLTSASVDYYDDNFVASLIDLNEALNRPENEDVNELVDSKLTTSLFGIHLIKATKTGQFEKPSAKFEEVDPLSPEFTVGSENDTDILSETQLSIYHVITIPDISGEVSSETLPTNVTIAITNFYQPLFEQYISAWGTNVLNLEAILAANPVFAIDSAARIAILQGEYDNLTAQSLLRSE